MFRTTVFTIWTFFVALTAASGQVQYGVPENAKGIQVEPHIGEYLPTDVSFVDEKGRTVALSSIIDGTVPVFVTLNYSNCPGLCIAQLSNLTKSLNDMPELKLGKDFRLISISIDPSETDERLAKTKERYAGLLDEQHDRSGWYFLRGSLESITKVAKATGFRYTYDAKSGQYSHAAVAIGVAPTGLMTRYLYDLAVDGATLRLAIIETSQGKLGTIGDQLLLWCYHFDESANRYSASARKLLSLTAALFVIFGLAFSLPFWLSRRNTKHGKAEQRESLDSSGRTP